MAKAKGNMISMEKIFEQIGRVPGAKVSREEYLTSTFKGMDRKGEVSLSEIIAHGTINAGVPRKELKKLANSAASLEGWTAVGTSFAAGVPGGLAIFATLPADVIQFFVHAFRFVQKLLYLYGWEYDVFDEDGDFLDDATRTQVILYLGTILGVGVASKSIAKIALNAGTKALRTNALKILLAKTIPTKIVRAILSKMGIVASAKLLTQGISKTIPIISGLLSGGMTYATFIPASKTLIRLVDKQQFEGFTQDELDKMPED